MIERHHDYALTIPSLPPGGLNELNIPLDSDAPFALRLVRSRNLAAFGGAWKIQNYKRQFQSSDFRTDFVYPQVAASPALVPFPSRGAPMFPQMIYPASSQLIVSVSNPNDTPLTNVIMLFRGSKIYRDGAVASYTYPPKFSPLTFIYSKVIPQVPLVGSVLGNQIQIQTDADFVFRAGAFDPFTISAYPETAPAGTVQELYVQMRDQDGKAYSNQPIHVDDLFGQGIPTTYPAVTFPSTHSINDDAVLEWSGLITPEIYLPSQTSLYFDVFRNDTTAGMNAVDLHFRFHGSKIFRR
jgi:hypothetical protein